MSSQRPFWDGVARELQASDVSGDAVSPDGAPGSELQLGPTPTMSAEVRPPAAIQAARRRIAEDPRQAAWDACPDPAALLEALRLAVPGPLATAARLAEESARTLASRAGGSFAFATRLGGPLACALAARALRAHDAARAVAAYEPVLRQLGRGADAPAAVAETIRRVYPCAPENWTGVRRVEEAQAQEEAPEDGDRLP